LDSDLVGLVSRVHLRRVARAALARAAAGRAAQLSIYVTGDAQIAKLNRRYRGIDAPTDVLSFAQGPETAGFAAPPDAADYLGDVVISYPRAKDQAVSFGHSPQDEIAILVVHGVLHLLGYDHDQVEDQERMWRIQQEVLSGLGVQWVP